MDWKWFVSTYAQCGAALIGVIAAFIISKLLNESERKEFLSQKLNDHKVEFDLIKGKLANRKFDTYNKRLMEESIVLGKAIEEGGFDELSTTEAEKKLYVMIPTLYYSKYNATRLMKMIHASNNDDIDSSMGTEEDMLPPISNFLNGGPDVEYASIEELKLLCKELIAKFTSTGRCILVQQRNLSTIRLNIVVLIVGFLCCVIYPLHFLPLRFDEVPDINFSLRNILSYLFSIQGGLLVLMSIVIIGIFGFFYAYSLRLERLYDSLINQMEYANINIEGYSTYFRSLEG